MIHIYTLDYCSYCNYALGLLKKHKILHKNFVVGSYDEKEKIKRQNGMNTFPQVFLLDKKCNKMKKLDCRMKVGGSEDLESQILNIKHKQQKEKSKRIKTESQWSQSKITKSRPYPSCGWRPKSKKSKKLKKSKKSKKSKKLKKYVEYESFF